jgi:hypothetical protein
VYEWEEYEFAARNELDYLISDFRRLDKSAERRVRLADGSVSESLFTYEEQLAAASQFLQNSTAGDTGQQERGDLRAHFYRFSATLYSRYEGGFPVDTPPFQNALYTADNLSDKPVTKWRRLYVPCRVKEKIEPPTVKLILPLTESYAEHTRHSAGLLLVLNDSWHQRGGLGEGVTVEVEQAPDPHNSAQGMNKFYYELGPDPILSGTSLQDENHLWSAVTLNAVRGPVGHTHDELDEGALFTATSFIIPPPEVSGATIPEDFSWYLCKIRVQRTIRLKGADNRDASAVLRSKFTEAQWAQYLPEFSLLRDATTVEDLHVHVDPAGNHAVLRGRQGQHISEAELLSPNEHNAQSYDQQFLGLLLLTKQAFDASGRSNQESFVGILRYHPGNQNWVPFSSSEPLLFAPASYEQIRFRARVMELQRARGQFQMPETLDALFERLFGERTSSLPDRAAMRIVRVSNPIQDRRGELSVDVLSQEQFNEE